MKIKGVIQLILANMLFLGILAASCSVTRIPNLSNTVTLPTPQLVSSYTETPGYATRTPIPPTITQTPILDLSTSPLVGSSIQSFTATFTPTGLPTMTRDEAQALLEDLFRTNGNCKAPCFWGIIPDKTTFTEADQFLKRFMGKANVKQNKDGEIYHYDNSASAKNGYLGMSIQLGIEKGVVETIQVFMGGFFEPGVNPEDWASYNLKGMLIMYGTPTRVLFSVDYPHEPTSNKGKVLYSYILYFEQFNVVIAYGEMMIDDAAQYKICPLNPNQEPSFLNLWIGSNPYGSFDEFVDLKQASNLTYEDFYKLFTTGNANSCILLDAMAFKPTPSS